jgi:hypothetical protein
MNLIEYFRIERIEHNGDEVLIEYIDSDPRMFNERFWYVIRLELKQYFDETVRFTRLYNSEPQWYAKELHTPKLAMPMISFEKTLDVNDL